MDPSTDPPPSGLPPGETLSSLGTSADHDSLLREIAGAPARTPGAIHLLAPGAIVAGKYRVEEKIGKGGMGAVFRAVDLRLGRPVAIKVHHGRVTSLERLRREARLLARLSHPNVVAVLEVGSHEGDPFVAMEYVSGGSARVWARQAGRRWREIVAIYVQAARGLAAAHAIGIVHRDFKPDNLLVGTDGRARVADFGLADALGVVVEDERVTLSLERAGIASEPGDERMTAAGSLVGTPAYVAPEQISSSRVDARADQFSFCAALYEALYGTLPFPGANALEVLGRIRGGDLAEPPTRRGVPRWLHAVLRRGMSRDPAARFVDMDALGDALGGPRSRRGPMVAVGGALVIGGLWLGTVEPTTDPRCADDPSHTWDARRAQVGERFVDEVEPTRDAWARLDRRLEARAQGWTAAWVTACAAERTDATPAALATMDRRLTCLDDERTLTDALLDAAEQADAAVIARLLQTASTWGDPLACIATEPGAAAPGETALDSGTRAALQRARAGANSGHLLAAEALVEVALHQAHTLGDDVLVAKSLLARGRTRLEFGRRSLGIDDLEAASTLAERVGDTDTVRDAAVLLAKVHRGDDLDAVMRWVTQARRHLHRWPDDADEQVDLLLLEAEVRSDRDDDGAAIALLDQAEDLAAQAGLPDELVAPIWLARGAVSVHRGDYGNAVLHAEHARELLENAFGPDHYRVATAWTELAFIYDSAGNYAEARDRYRRALALFDAPGGGVGRAQAFTLVQLAQLETMLGNSAAALIDLDRADTVIASISLDDPFLVMASREARGLALLDLDRLEEAYDIFVEVTELREQRWGSAHPNVRVGLLNLALAARSIGRQTEARAALARAVRIQDDLQTVDLIAADVYHADGFALLDEGDDAGAKRRFEQAAKLLRQAFGDDHPDHGWPALGLARVELRGGRPTEALELLRRAEAAWSNEGGDPQGRAETAESIAEALWALGRRDEAIAGARAALAARPEHAGIRAWLHAHAPGAAAPPESP